MSIRRILAACVAALIVTGAGYTVYWFHALGTMRKGVETWAEQRRAQGWTVELSDMDGSGYPTRLRLSVDHPTIITPSGLTWKAETLAATAQPFDWSEVKVEAPGAHRLEWGENHLTLSSTITTADIVLDRRGALDEATLLGRDVRIEGAAAQPITIEGLAVTWDPLPVDHPDHTQASIHFSATGHGVTLPAFPNLPLDQKITLAEITGRVMGALPTPPDSQAVAAWAADGGTVEVEHLSLDWPPMAAEADGTLALDPNGQPLVALAARVRGAGALLDRLAEKRIMEPSAAQAAKLILMMMAKPDAKGRPAVNMPINLQDGALMLGTVPVFQVPPVRW